jgi:hypothetical protein
VLTRSSITGLVVVLSACSAQHSHGASETVTTPDAGTSSTAGVTVRDASAEVRDNADAPSKTPRIRYVFVLAMENKDEGSIIGNAKDASYINGELVTNYALGSNFVDRLPVSIASEPHYVWMQAGTNEFSDHTFSTDDAPSRTNSTANKDHLVNQLDASGHTWMSYQEGIDDVTGACPIEGSNFYAPKHDPFIFFRDIAGNPPSKTAPVCVAHHKAYSQLANDLRNDSVSEYNFITPNLCHDMHGQDGCPNPNNIQAGDEWLRDNLPPLIAYCDQHDGVIFLVWDEGESNEHIPFIAVSARVKAHYASAIEYDHGSLVRSIEEIFDLPILPKVQSAADFADLFQPAMFP